MGLGNRNAKRHETTASRHVAGVDPSAYWDFKPGQTVMTVDGFLGKVTAVHDGPHAGNEEYEVTLLNGLGGGIYRSGQLTASVDHTATENTAARDYPELAQVLAERPDPGKYPSSTLGLIASLHTAAEGDNPHERECTNQRCVDYQTRVPDDHQHQPLGGKQAAKDMWGNPYPEGSSAGAWADMDADYGTGSDYTEPDHVAEEHRGLGGLPMADESEFRRTPDAFHGGEGYVYKNAGRARSEASTCDGDCGTEYHFDRNGEATFHAPSNGVRGDRHQGAHDITVPGSFDGNGMVHFECPTCGHDNSEYEDADTAKHLGSVHKDAAYYTEADLRAEADRYLADRGITLAQAVAESMAQQEAHFAAVGEKPGLCENGHLTWGDDCASCRNSDGGDNAMVVNPGDHRPQDVENTKNASREDTNVHCPQCGGQTWYDADKHPHGSEMDCPDCGKTFQITSSIHDTEEDEYGHDDDEPFCAHCGDYGHDDTAHESPCPLCGNNRTPDGMHPYNGVGVNQECPNGRGSGEEIERIADSLPDDKYCGEACKDSHAQDIHQGLDEDRNSEHAPEIRKADEQNVCRTCGTPLMGSVGDQISGIGTPAEHAFLKSNPTGPSKYSALQNAERLMVEAVLDADLCFQITASWNDVRTKAKRIRSEGGVHITSTDNGLVVASVKGDHDTYESVLMRVPGTQKIGQWDCACKWAKYHWGAPDDTSRFAGRMCSHALALNLEAQSRGMFGREVRPDQGVPRWLNKSDVGRIASREVTPLHVLAGAMHSAGVPQAEIEAALSAFGSVNSPFGEPGPNEPFAEPGPTKPRNAHDNPASSGFLTASDPESWSAAQTPSLDRMASLDDALFEPEMSHTAIVAVPEIAEALAGAGEAAGGAGAAGGEAGAAGAGEAAGGGMKMPGMPKIPGMGGGHGGDGGSHKIMDSINNHADAAAASGNAVRDEAESVGSAMSEDLNGRRQSTLNDEPEPALPTTGGGMDDDDGQTWSGYAGDPDPDPHTATVSTGIDYAVPSDVGTQSVPQQVAPGSSAIRSASDDALSPANPSIMTQGSVADIVAEFQRTAGAASLDAGASKDSGEIAAAAKAFLQKSAMAEFTPAQQREIIDEGDGGHVRASNLDRLQIEGTHYEALESALAKNDNDDDSWMD